MVDITDGAGLAATDRVASNCTIVSSTMYNGTCGINDSADMVAARETNWHSAARHARRSEETRSRCDVVPYWVAARYDGFAVRAMARAVVLCYWHCSMVQP